MVVRRAAILALCVVLSTVMAPPTAADPDAETAAASVASDEGRVPSSDPVTFTTPEGWTLTLGAKDESQVPIAPLTTAVSSREYLARGTFVGSLDGLEQPRGVLEVGYEIGCGIDMSTSNGVTIGGSAGVTPGLGITGLAGTPGILPLVTVPMNGVVTVGLKPGVVIDVPVAKKEFKGPNPRVIVTGFHVKIDGCVGQSFIRSFATLTQVTDESDVVLSYVGVTKSV
ncbi:MspA family porin [Mycobacterium nebraskense]|uniref:MspA family porin n=1 Tax=Mycobacterium nebraskense TaxID=244292 RepID=UPI000641E75A|nr:MspA family porin [Mycobacterium nebraskense]KLO33288.1 MspA protein [Mycobacterium nebraskense]MBI2696097.1 MspA family porin [Mycobacterium nebraskense]